VIPYYWSDFPSDGETRARQIPPRDGVRVKSPWVFFYSSKDGTPLFPAQSLPHLLRSNTFIFHRIVFLDLGVIRLPAFFPRNPALKDCEVSIVLTDDPNPFTEQGLRGTNYRTPSPGTPPSRGGTNSNRGKPKETQDPALEETHYFQNWRPWSLTTDPLPRAPRREAFHFSRVGSRAEPGSRFLYRDKTLPF